MDKYYELDTQLELIEVGEYVEVRFKDEVLSVRKEKLKHLKPTDSQKLQLPDGQSLDLIFLDAENLYIEERMEDVSTILQECFSHDASKRKSPAFRNAVVELLDELRRANHALK